jgi:hypothetical protein
MKLRTVVRLLSGVTVSSTWASYTDKEFDEARYAVGHMLIDTKVVYTLVQEVNLPGTDRNVYIPVRNIDMITIETTSDDNDTAGYGSGGLGRPEPHHLSSLV